MCECRMSSLNFGLFFVLISFYFSWKNFNPYFFFMKSTKIIHWLILLKQSLNCSTASQLRVDFVLSAKSEGLRTMRFRLGHDTSSKQHNMSWSKFQCQMSGQNMIAYLMQKRWKLLWIRCFSMCCGW